LIAAITFLIVFHLQLLSFILLSESLFCHQASFSKCHVPVNRNSGFAVRYFTLFILSDFKREYSVRSINLSWTNSTCLITPSFMKPSFSGMALLLRFAVAHFISILFKSRSLKQKSIITSQAFVIMPFPCEFSTIQYPISPILF